MSFDPLVPIVFHGSTLGEDDGGVEYAGDCIKCNKTPEECFPFLALETRKSISHGQCQVWDQ